MWCGVAGGVMWCEVWCEVVYRGVVRVCASEGCMADMGQLERPLDAVRSNMRGGVV